MYKVYCWTNKINGKRYVGMTGRTIKKRAGSHMYHYHGSIRFWNAIQKYGEENFVYTILASGLTKEEAADKERYYIRKYKTQDRRYGYNIFAGGYHDYDADTAVDRATRIANTLHEQRSSPEYRAIMSERMQRVWDDPARREAMIQSRRKKSPYGRHKEVALYCCETDEVYLTLSDAARALSLCRATIQYSLERWGDCTTVGEKKGTLYHIAKIPRKTALKFTQNQ